MRVGFQLTIAIVMYDPGSLPSPVGPLLCCLHTFQLPEDQEHCSSITKAWWSRDGSGSDRKSGFFFPLGRFLVSGTW